MSAEWDGPECFMCGGTGAYHASAGTPIPGTPFHDGRRTIRTNLPCPACNGHGREPSSGDGEVTA